MAGLADLLGPTDVEGIDVTGRKKPADEFIQGMPPVDLNTEGFTTFNPPQMDEPPAPEQAPPPMNYDNSGAQSALMSAMRGIHPEGGSTNPGVYGLLPQKLQHGTLRNVLGAIGDAFLVQSDHPATYAPHMQRQQVGLAMAGLDPNDPQSVQAAIQRVATTGAPDSIELADRMQKNFNDAEYKKQTAESNRIYRQSMTESRQDQAIQRMVPNIGAMVRNVKNKEQYDAAYQRAELIAQRIGPDYHATDFGLVEPENWTPDASQTAGLSANNLLTSEDKAKQRTTTERGQDVGYRGRVDAAGMGASSRIAAANISASKPTGATILDDLIEQQTGDVPLDSKAKQATFDHMTQVTHKPRRLPGAKPAAASNGPVVTNGDVSYLKSNPGARAAFDKHFGKGAAAKYLGK